MIDIHLIPPKQTTHRRLLSIHLLIVGEIWYDVASSTFPLQSKRRELEKKTRERPKKKKEEKGDSVRWPRKHDIETRISTYSHHPEGGLFSKNFISYKATAYFQLVTEARTRGMLKLSQTSGIPDPAHPWCPPNTLIHSAYTCMHRFNWPMVSLINIHRDLVTFLAHVLCGDHHLFACLVTLTDRRGNTQ